ncbi:autotransporter outer membrane beta-barrel domain-containing protein [Pseudomonas sp. ML96]|uniref:autotransporter outer membrane beta-barrel domain-containing protein n=1 Tax=Pseudomonas sp. ML96 TaxID=1523503 RepID=UPI0012DFF3D7|nr:autotransporter outer membrane beta-barrel domain-containing protein [Pseudomonas sp. ML96]
MNKSPSQQHAKHPPFLPTLLAMVITAVSSAPGFAQDYNSPEVFQPWGDNPTSELHDAHFEVDAGNAAITVQGMDFSIDHSDVHNAGNGTGVQLDLWDASKHVDLDTVHIETDGNGAGLLENGGQANMSNSSVITHGAGAAGLDVQTGGALSYDHGSVETEGDNAAALHAHNNGSAQLEDAQLSTHGDHSAAVQIDNDGSLVLHGGTLHTEGADSAGINASNGAQLQVDGVQIDTLGDGSHGIHISSNGADYHIDNSSIHTQGAGSIGVMVNNASGAAVLDNTQVITDGAGSHGLYTSQGTHIDLTAGSSVQTSGDSADGAWTAEGGSIDIIDSSLSSTGKDSAAAHALAAGSLVIERSSLNSSGEHGAALHLDNGGRATVTDSQLSSSSGSALLFSQGSQAYGSAEVDLSGSLVDSDGALVSAESGSVGNLRIDNSELHSGNGVGFAIAQGANLQTVLTGSSLDTGASGLLAQVVGDGSLKLSSYSSDLRGDTQLQDASSGTLDLDLHSATWRMNGNSSLSNLDLENANVVFNAANGFHTLSIAGDLTGSGSFQMNTDLSSVQGDLISVGGHAEGQHTLVIADSGREADGTQLLVVETHGGAGQFDLYGDHVDAGAYRYNLEQKGQDWYLVGADNGTGPVDPVDPVDPTDPGTDPGTTDPDGPGGNTGKPGGSGNEGKPSQPDILSKGSNVALGMQSAAANLYYSELGTLTQRLGELRLGHDQGGVWVRGIGKSLHMNENRSRAYDQNLSGVEIGADRAIALDQATLYVGGMVGASRSDMDFGERSSGDIESRMLGAYATYLRDDGWYVDNVIKYNRLDGDTKVISNVDESVKGDYSGNAVGVSVEVGKQIDLGDGWFVEPQAQLAATHLEGPQYTSSDGLKVKASDTDSVQGRLGVRGGRTMRLDSGMQLQSYLITSYIDELSGDQSVTVNGHKFDNALPGSRTEIGIGNALQISPQQKVSLEANYANGHDMEQPWAVTLGYRYLW